MIWVSIIDLTHGEVAAPKMAAIPRPGEEIDLRNSRVTVDKVVWDCRPDARYPVRVYVTGYSMPADNVSTGHEKE